MDPFRKLYYTLQSVARHPLHRGRPWGAMRDFCVAQVAVRLIPGEVCVAFPNQTRLLIPPGMKGAAHFISPGLCEFDEMSFVAHFLRKNDTFVDVGANVGAFTVLASGVAGARTIAFEPSPRTFDILQRNVWLNNLSALATPIHAAVGRVPGKLQLTESLGTENYICPTGTSGVEVEVTTLDASVRESSPTVIKIDVEGFETEVIGGAAETLRNPSLLAMIVERTDMGNRYGYDEATIHEKIRGAGFIPCAYSANDRHLREIECDARGNIVYVRDVRAAQNRLRVAPRFMIRDQSV